MHDFQQPEAIVRQSDANDGQVELPELEPGVAGVLVLDLDDAAMPLRCVNQQRIGLTPAFSRLILELKPRPIPVHELRPAERKKREVILHLPLVSQSDCESATTLSPCYKLWFLR